MVEYNAVEVLASTESSINDEVMRNVKVLLTTFSGTVPFDRDFGINPEIIDLPVNEAEGMYMMECITKIRKYEPRVNVVKIDFKNNLEGKLYPKVVLSIEPE